MSKTPMSLILMLNSIAEGTMDFLTQDPTNAKKYCKT